MNSEVCIRRSGSSRRRCSRWWLPSSSRFLFDLPRPTIPNRRNAGAPCVARDLVPLPTPAERRAFLSVAQASGLLALHLPTDRASPPCRGFQGSAEERNGPKERKPRITQPERSEDGLANFLRKKTRQIARIFSTDGASRYSVGNSFASLLIRTDRGREELGVVRGR